MNVEIKISHALKKFGDNVIIPDLSLDIHPGEFFTLLGPSGCGKTTLLRMIAGFNSIEGGDFYFGDRRINDLDPAKRNIGMVFQNYAIFPHLSVRNNVAFGLKERKLPKAQVIEQTNKFMKLMHIDEYADRMPDRLSGGQQQRVALARALSIEPDVLLMDEPLSNLDAKLRVEMRNVIKQIQHQIGITTVYVTHDQEEALAISDRIAVMNDGVIQQIGTPKHIYQRPANEFVSTFIGLSNLLDADCRDNTLVFGDQYRVPVKTLREGASPRHVPAMIFPVDDIPFTMNGKKVESAVTNIMNGRDVTNRSALSNPDALDIYIGIRDDLLEVFPFVLKFDRYCLAMSGIQHFDQRFQYHISVLKSPVPFRFGINISGNFDSWKWKLGRALYKNTDVPVFTAQVDTLKYNLVSSIHNIFTRGVDIAVERTRALQDSIAVRKEQVGLVRDYLSRTADAQVDTLMRSRLDSLKSGRAVMEPMPGEKKEDE